MNELDSSVVRGSKQMHGKYVGPVQLLRDKTALLLYEPGSFTVHAQFDDLALPAELTHGWQLYELCHFNIDDTYYAE